MSGSDDVIITIGGVSTGLQSAVQQASATLDALRVTMQTTADSSKILSTATTAQGVAWVDSATNAADYAARLDVLRVALSGAADSQDLSTQAIIAATDQMRMAQETSAALADATKLLGDAYAQQAAAFLDASTSAADYAARLDFLQTQMAGVTAQQDEQSFSMSGLMGAFAQGGFSLSSFTALMGDMGGPFDAVISAVGGLVDNIGQFIAQGAMLIGTIVAFQGFMDAANEVEQLTEQMFQLNEQTQKTAYTWKYLFGGGAGGMGISQNLMQWTAQASLSMPYTRQDIMNSITSMLSISGMKEGDIQQYLPMLSDLGASRNPNLDLSGVVNAVVGAEFGYTRMLRYDLHINPQDLAKYGLDINKAGHVSNPSTLLPALMAYSKAHGYLGAGQDIAQNTWWGAWSSFVDRIQNAGLEVGGLSQNGMAAPNSMFGAMMKDLTNVSSWLDAHKDDLKYLEDLVANLIGGAVAGGGGLLGALFQTLGQSGLVSDASNWLYSMDQSLQDMLGHPATSPRPTNGKNALSVSKHPRGVDVYGQSSGAGTAHAATPNVFAEWGKDLAPLVADALQLAGAIGQVNAAVAPLAGALGGGFMQGLSQFHISGGILDYLKQFAAIINNPAFKQYEGILGGILGAIAGFAGSGAVKAFEQFADADLKTAAQDMPAVQKAFGDLQGALKNFANSFTPEEKQDMKAFAAWLVQVAGSTAAHIAVAGLAAAFSGLANVFNFLATAVQKANSAWSWLKQHADMQKWADDLKKNMSTWGADMLDSFIKGIQSKMGDLNKTIGGIASSIAAKLHFSRPDEGPLASSDTWMPDMMRLLSDGMDRNVHQVASASRRVAQSLADPLGGGRGGPLGGGYGGSSSASASYSSAYTDARSTSAAIHVHGVNEAAVEEIVARRLAQQNRLGRASLLQPGGFRRFGDIGAGMALG